MPAQIVFLTLFLGIASGTQPLILEVTGPVHSVRVLLGGREVAHMKAPLWETRAEFDIVVDDRSLTVGTELHARLPKIDREKTHILAAELEFPDGFVARRETVLEAALSASTATQLTPVGLRDTGKGHPRSWNDCLTHADGKPATYAKLAAATARVRRALDEKRVGWVGVDPLEALRLKASPRCGLETLAQP